MRRILVVSAPVAVALVVAAVATAASSLPFTSRILRNGEMAGFRLTQKAKAVSDEVRFMKALGERGSIAAKDAASLRADGFTSGIVQPLLPTDRNRQAQGVSYVFELRSPATAHARVVREFTNAKSFAGKSDIKFRQFTTGIPGARGFSQNSPTYGSGVNILFSDGPYVYLVGQGALKRSAISGPSVIHAAKSLYNRVRGK